MKRTILAGLIAPLVPAVFVIILNGPYSFYVWYSYILSWIVGIPTVWVLKRMKKETHWIYALLGFAGGMGLIVMFGVSDLNALLTNGGFLAGSLLGILGLITALCFSLIQGLKNQKIPTERSTYSSIAVTLGAWLRRTHRDSSYGQVIADASQK